MLSLSRKELADGLCTEKYIYLIEKGERSPSIDIISMISERLGVDLFDYYQYLGCNNPIVVRESIRHFNICRRKNDYVELERITKVVSRYPDFNIKPWIYEIELNLLTLILFQRRKYKEGKEKIINLLEELEVKYANSYYAVNLYMLLSACNQFLGDLAGAKEAVLTAERMLSDKQDMDKYNHIRMAVKVCSISNAYHSGEYELAIQKGVEFLQYLYSLSVYLYLYYVYFYLSFSNYNLRRYQEASEYFKKGINSLMLEERQSDVNLLYELEEFKILLYQSGLTKGCIEEFLRRYNLA